MLNFELISYDVDTLKTKDTIMKNKSNKYIDLNTLVSEFISFDILYKSFDHLLKLYFN